MSRKIIFVNRYFYPDVSATAQMLADLCFALAAEGHSVSVVTSVHRYNDKGPALPVRETIRGVQVYRCRGTRFGRQSLPGRLADYISFYLAAMYRVLMLLRPDSMLVVKTDPPMLASAMLPIALLRRARLVNWLQDIFPEIAGSLDHIPVRGYFLRGLISLRDATCRRVYSNVVISEGMRNFLLEQCIPAEKVTTIANWAPLGVQAVDPEANRLRSDWGLKGRFVIGYSGNLGRAHDWSSLLSMIEGLDSEPELCFLFIGGGDGMSHLRSEIERLGLTRVLFKPYQPRERLSEALSAIDLHLVSLDGKLASFLVPSKIYGIAAVGRPAIFIGPAENEVSRLLAEYGFGLTIANGQKDQLVAAILELIKKPSKYRTFCQNALLAHSEHFNFSHALSSWEKVLTQNGPSLQPVKRA